MTKNGKGQQELDYFPESRRNFQQELEHLQRRDQERRNQFLQPPPHLSADASQGNAPALLERAARLMERAGEKPVSPALRKALLRWEADTSSAMDREYGRGRVRRNQAALQELMAQRPGGDSLLQYHAALMQGQEHAQPGKYRTGRVRPPSHQPPPHPVQDRTLHHSGVPRLMRGLFAYVNGSRDPISLRAAWAYMQFETIQPFADGNGRAGRALITQMAGMPLPLSAEILRREGEYRRTLERGDWQEWLEWFLARFAEACEEFINAR